jgi:hypothetical protein
VIKRSRFYTDKKIVTPKYIDKAMTKLVYHSKQVTKNKNVIKSWLLENGFNGHFDDEYAKLVLNKMKYSKEEISK